MCQNEKQYTLKRTVHLKFNSDRLIPVIAQDVDTNVVLCLLI